MTATKNNTNKSIFGQFLSASREKKNTSLDKKNNYSSPSISNNPKFSISNSPLQPPNQANNLLTGVANTNKPGYMSGLYKRIQPRGRSNQQSNEVQAPTTFHFKVHIGSFVCTPYGTGTVLDTREIDHFYLVRLVPNMLAYLRPEMIIREIKAIVGERVQTQWGMGTIENYWINENLYEIALDWRWDDDHVWRMKATVEKFERVSSSSLFKKTGEYISEGYSNFRERINSTNSRFASISLRRPPPKVICKVFTKFGDGDLLEVRQDKIHVVGFPGNSIAFLQASSVIYHRKLGNKILVGDRINTAYGIGIVMKHRQTDNILEVDLQDWIMANNKRAKVYMPMVNLNGCHSQSSGRIQSILNTTKKGLFNAGVSMKVSATGGFTSFRAKLTGFSRTKRLSRYRINERVITPFGSGFIQQIRFDHFYVIRLRRLKIVAYIHEGKIASFPTKVQSHLK